MAIPKTGARPIVVDGLGYRWRIRRQATNMQSDYGFGKLHVAIESSDAPGTTLVLMTDRPHPQDFTTYQVKPIQPADVADWIRRARLMGWNPSVNGSPLFLKINGEVMGTFP